MKLKHVMALPDALEVKADLMAIPQEVLKPLMDWMRADSYREGLRIEVSSPRGPLTEIGFRDRSIEGTVVILKQGIEVECRLIWDSDSEDFVAAPISVASTW